MRVLKWTGYAGFLLLAIAIAALSILLVTRTGVGMLVNAAQRLDPGLEVRGYSGSLLGTICAAQLQYTNRFVDVQAEDACFNLNLWDSVDLLKLSLESLRARDITITVPAGAPESAPGRGFVPPLPFAIELDSVAVTNFRYQNFTLSDISGVAALSSKRLSLNADFSFEDYELTLYAQGAWQALTVKATLQVPETLQLEGTLDLSQPELSYRALVSADQLDLEPWIPAPVKLARTRLLVQGDLLRYQYEINTDLTMPAFGSATLTSQGSGDRAGLTLNAEAALAPATDMLDSVETMSLDGRVDWQPELTFTLNAATDAVTARFERRTLTLGGRLQLAGSPDDMQIHAESLLGTLDTFPVAGHGSLRWHRRTADIDTLELQIGEGSLKLDGQVTGEQASRLNAEIRNLPLVLIDGRLRGDISGTLQLSDYPQAAQLTTQLTAYGAGFENLEAQTIALNYHGSLNRGHAVLEMEHALGRATSELELQLGQNDYTVTISRLDATLADPLREGSADEEATDNPAAVPAGVRLQLVAPASLHLAAGELSLDRTCFQAYLSEMPDTPSRACLSILYPQGPAALQIEGLQLPIIALPVGDLAAEAAVEADVRVASFAPLSATADVALSRLVSHIDDYQKELGDLRVQASAEANNLKLTISSPEAQALVSSGAVTAVLADELPESEIAGEISVTIDGIRLVEEFLPMELAYELSNLTGQMQAKAGLTGTLGAPLIDARIQVADAAWRLNASGSEFHQVHLTAALEDSGSVGLKAAGGIGEGSFELDGSLSDLGAADARLTTSVSFADSRIVELPDYKADLSGSLNLEMTSTSLNLKGNLTMPQARIVIAELPASAISVSDDTVIVGSSENGTHQQVRTTSIRLKLGDAVHLTAFGLQTRLEGVLTLTETPGKPPDLRGVVTLHDGIFKAYGQELSIQQGKLTFIGPMDDPVVDLIAVRTIKRASGDVKVSLILSGSAKAIETDVRSDPVLPEGDALALLLTGRTFSEMTSGEQTNAYGAAIALGLYGASGIRRNLADTFGLEEIIVEQDSDGEWEVGAAVRLQENLYLRYTYSVFSRLGGVLLRYRLSDRVSVRAQTGDAHSIEIRYGVD